MKHPDMNKAIGDLAKNLNYWAGLIDAADPNHYFCQRLAHGGPGKI
jgi:hypothetical protein